MTDFCIEACLSRIAVNGSSQRTNAMKTTPRSSNASFCDHTRLTCEFGLSKLRVKVISCTESEVCKDELLVEHNGQRSLFVITLKFQCKTHERDDAYEEMSSAHYVTEHDLFHLPCIAGD